MAILCEKALKEVEKTYKSFGADAYECLEIYDANGQKMDFMPCKYNLSMFKVFADPGCYTKSNKTEQFECLACSKSAS